MMEMAKCETCNGTGKEICDNPDHGFIGGLNFCDVGRNARIAMALEGWLIMAKKKHREMADIEPFNKCGKCNAETFSTKRLEPVERRLCPYCNALEITRLTEEKMGHIMALIGGKE